MGVVRDRAGCVVLRWLRAGLRLLLGIGLRVSGLPVHGRMPRQRLLHGRSRLLGAVLRQVRR